MLSKIKYKIYKFWYVQLISWYKLLFLCSAKDLPQQFMDLSTSNFKEFPTIEKANRYTHNYDFVEPQQKQIHVARIIQFILDVAAVVVVA